MANLENVSADDLRETLAKVDDGDAVKRLMAAIAFKEIDEVGRVAKPFNLGYRNLRRACRIVSTALPADQ